MKLYDVAETKEYICWRTSWCCRRWLISQEIRFPKTASQKVRHISHLLRASVTLEQNIRTDISATAAMYMAESFKTWRGSKERESCELPKEKKGRDYTLNFLFLKLSYHKIIPPKIQHRQVKQIKEERNFTLMALP